MFLCETSECYCLLTVVVRTVPPDLIYSITRFLLVSFCALFLQLFTGSDII